MKGIEYYKNNCEEDYITTPISVLRYITELESEVERLKNHVTTDNSKVNENLLKENKDLKECLKTVRSQLFDKNNKETLLTNIIDETLNNN